MLIFYLDIDKTNMSNLWNVPNPNLLSGQNIINDTLSESVFPKMGGGNVKNIFDQVILKKTLFDPPKQINTVNPNLLTYQELDYYNKGDLEAEKQTTIIGVNDALKNNNFILAEDLLGRALTPLELSRGRVTDEKIYDISGSQPEYKNFEDLNLTFDVSESTEEKKLNDLISALKRYNISYDLDKLDNNIIKIKSYKKVKNVLFPKPITTVSREEEDFDTPFKKFDIEMSGWKTTIQRAKEKQVKEWADKLGIKLTGTKGELKDIKNIVKKILEDYTGVKRPSESKEMEEIRDTRPFGAVERSDTRRDDVPPTELRDIPQLEKVTGQGVGSKFANFGKYKINLQALDKNILKFKTQKGFKTLNIPDSYISSKMVTMMKNLMKDGNIDFNQYNRLGKDEKQLLEYVILKSKASLEIPSENNTGYFSDRKLLERLPILIGSLEAGNNSNSLKNEIAQVLEALKDRKLIHRKTAYSISKKIFGGNI